MFKKAVIVLFPVLFLSVITGQYSIAENDETVFFDLDKLDQSLNRKKVQSKIPSDEIFRRTQAVLKYYKAQESEFPSEFLNDIQSPRTLTEVQAILKWMDPLKSFASLSTLSSNEILIFKDKVSKEQLDFNIKLSGKSVPVKRPKQFKGLRIALDPGHMGGDFWDRQTGKYVQDKNGRVLSEGVLNLQLCFLLKKIFEDLGAIVLVTHEGLSPVSKIDYKTFDLKPFAQYEIRENIHAEWFQNLLAQAPAGPKLFALFDQSPQIKRLFSERSRSEYFIKRADLWARADLINAFSPDIVLIVHHDTVSSTNSSTENSNDNVSGKGLNPNAPNETKSFIFGSYEGNEFGTSSSRAYFIRHLVEKESFDHSVLLSRSIAQQMKKKLGLNLDTSSGNGSVLVEPGIRCRNLLLPRNLKAQNVAYLENLFYNRPQEFEALFKQDFKMVIDGKVFYYSKRLVQLADAIFVGVGDFLETK